MRRCKSLDRLLRFNRFLLKSWDRAVVIGGLVLFLGTQAACNGPGFVAHSELGTPFYLPPSMAVKEMEVQPNRTIGTEDSCEDCINLTPGITPSHTTGQPIPGLDCDNNLRFVGDVTIPDGTQVMMGELLDKRWKVENSGTCNWDKDYRLKLVAGSSLSATSEQALYPTRIKNEAIIRLAFIAPDTPGVYRSAWQAYSPQGEAFGDPFFIEIVVVQASTSP